MTIRKKDSFVCNDESVIHFNRRGYLLKISLKMVSFRYGRICDRRSKDIKTILFVETIAAKGEVFAG